MAVLSHVLLKRVELFKLPDAEQKLNRQATPVGPWLAGRAWSRRTRAKYAVGQSVGLGSACSGPSLISPYNKISGATAATTCLIE